MIDVVFTEKGAPGDPPDGNCQEKSIAWLKRASADPNIDALGVLGGVLEEFMEVDNPRSLFPEGRLEEQRKRVTDILDRHGLTYRPGGIVLGTKTAAPTRSLEAVLRSRDLTALDVEFHRALDNVEKDPAQLADDGLKRILTGLASIVDGLGTFRTHVGSAHGRGRQSYKPAPRHARLALHSAHTLAIFVLETWDARKIARTR